MTLVIFMVVLVSLALLYGNKVKLETTFHREKLYEDFFHTKIMLAHILFTACGNIILNNKI